MGENVLFGAEIDPTTFTKGTTAIVNSLEQVNVKQKQVQEQFEITTQKLEAVQNEIKGTTTELANLSKGQAGFTDASKKLNDKLVELRNSANSLSVVNNKQQTELQKLVEQSEKYKNIVDRVTAASKVMGDQVSKPVKANVDLGQVTDALTKLERLKGAFSEKFGGLLINQLDFSEINGLDQKLVSLKGDFAQISEIVDTLGQKLLTLEPGTAEFSDLAEVIGTGKSVLEEYNKQFDLSIKKVQSADQPYKSLRQRIAEYRKELDLLEEAGLGESQQFKDITLAAAKLTDEYGDMQQQIRVLASDSKYLDFGVSTIQAAASGYQVAEGALALLGLTTEDVQAVQTKLLAVMNLVNGMQQLQNLLLKENIIQTVGAKIATETYAVSQRILQVTLGGTVAASRAANAALITTGVGALLVAVGFLVSKIIEWNDATNAAKDANDRLNQSLENQKAYMTEDLALIDQNSKERQTRIKERSDDERLIYEDSQKTYVEKIKFYNDEQIRLQNEYNELSKKSTQDLSKAELALVQASRQKIIEQQNQINTDAIKLKQANILVQAQEDLRQANDELARQKRARQAQTEARIADTLNLQSKEQTQLKADFDEQIRNLARAGQSTVEVENLYHTKRYEISEKYRKLRIEEEKKLDNELLKLQLDEADKRIENIQDEFERQRSAIAEEFIKGKSDLQQNQNALLNAALKDKIELGLKPEVYEATVNGINAVFDRMFSDLEERIRQANINLGNFVLNDRIKDLEAALHIDQNSSGEGENEEIKLQSKLYVSGKENYDNYQKALIEIAYRRGQERLKTEIATLQQELALVNQRLLGDISEKEKKDLLTQQSDLYKKISDLQTEVGTDTANRNKQIEDDNLAHLDKMIAAYSNFAQTIVGFISDIESAEAAQLDRSIALQQKRVDNAKYLAERGNAEYLELEQKRMDALLLKQQQNAQKQLAINNALTTSQALLAAISAVAKAASSSGGFVEAIAAGAAIVATIGAMYKFVSSLQTPTAQFYEGSEYVEQGRHKAGRDTIPARLNIGERVITTDTNKEYWDTLHAVHNKAIPANVLNEFVNMYPQIKIPAVDYSRINLATERHFEAKNQKDISKELGQLNSTMEAVVDKLDNLNTTHINLDQYGFAVSFIQAVKNEKLKWLN